MQAVQRKTEYRPAAPPRKRVVKIEDNVAYIGSGVPKKPRGFRGESPKPPKDNVIRGSAARPGSSVVSSPAKQNVRKADVADSKTKPHTGVVSTIIVLFMAFCALALLVSRYAAVCVINSENSRIKSDITSLEARIEELKVNIELQNDLEYVRSTAVGKLGMKYPDQSQKVSLDMS
jgi:cell division protein FtsL